MKEASIMNRVSSIPIEKLVPHPDNPNRMSKGNSAKLTRNIKRAGRYEPLVVRPCPQRKGFFQLIHGHSRWRAICELGYSKVDVMVWDIDDRETDMLLATINRLRGSDVLDKKLTVLRRLDRQMRPCELARLLPFSQTQIERLTKISTQAPSRSKPARVEFAAPLVFFVNNKQQKMIERALSLAREKSGGKTRAEKNATALASIAECFNLKSADGGCRGEDQASQVGE